MTFPPKIKKKRKGLKACSLPIKMESKPIPKTKRWAFTNFNLEEKPKLNIKKIQYLVYQTEETKEGNKHYQGFVIFSSPVSLPGFKERIGQSAHAEPCYANDSVNITYCTKEKSRVAPPIYFGILDYKQYKKELTNLNKFRVKWCKKILELGLYDRLEEEDLDTFLFKLTNCDWDYDLNKIEKI